MIRINWPLCFVLLGVLFFTKGFTQGTSWSESKKNGAGTLVITYSENSPFIYKNKEGELEGIEFEIINKFIEFVDEHHGVSLEVEWEYFDKFENLLDTLKNSTRPILGMASLSVTEARKKELKFCKPYMPDIEVIVSSGNIKSAGSIKEFESIVKNSRAISVSNSTFESNILDLKENYFPEIEIEYVSQVDVLVDSISRSSDLWGYISLPNYMLYLTEGKNINRQRFFMVEHIGISIATPLSSDWDIPLNSFFEDPSFTTLLNSLINKYLGSLFNNVVWSISDKSPDMFPNIVADKELGVLTLERELQDLIINKNELELRNKNLIIYLAAIGIILVLVALLAVYRLMRLKNKTNKRLSEKNERIETQAENLLKSYDNLKLLSKVGQDISSSLSVEKINEIVYNNLNGLMDAAIFGIGIYNPIQKVLEFPGVMEDGVKLNFFSYDIDDSLRLAVKCFTEKREIVIRNLKAEFEEYVQNIVSTKEGENAVSIVYVPLIIGNKSMGVLTVQSFQEEAFSDYQIDIVRNVANYAKIALDNASAYEMIYLQTDDLKNANLEISKKNKLIEQQNQELLELNKEKNHLIGIVAHDLKNPITSAISVTDLFKNEKGLNEEHKEYLYLITKCLNRVNNLVTKILDINVIEANKINLTIVDTDLRHLLEQIIDDFKDQCDKKNIKIVKDMNDTLVAIDHSFAIQIFENLISNAIKFSHPKSKIFVRMKAERNLVHVEIEDEGPGFSADDKTKLFGKFQKLSAQPTGGEESTGLGLSIVKKYVEVMDGKVWCESEDGKGAKFIVELNKVS